MFTKYAVTLAALLVFGGTSVAVAIEDPESRIGDRFPFLEKIDRTAAKPAAIQRGIVRQNAKLDLYRNETVENKIADRYPHLEQAAPPATATLQPVTVQRNAQLALYTNEDVENKIADRYPFLEQTTTIASAATPVRVIARTTSAQKMSMRRHARTTN
jgi:hypothetical protein